MEVVVVVVVAVAVVAVELAWVLHKEVLFLIKTLWEILIQVEVTGKRYILMFLGLTVWSPSQDQ